LKGLYHQFSTEIVLCIPLTLDQYRSQACPYEHLRIQTAWRSSTPASSPDVAHRDVGDWIRSPVAIVGIRCHFSCEIDGSGVLVQFCECEVIRICAYLIYERRRYIVIDLLTELWRVCLPHVFCSVYTSGILLWYVLECVNVCTCLDLLDK